MDLNSVHQTDDAQFTMAHTLASARENPPTDRAEAREREAFALPLLTFVAYLRPIG